MTDRWVTFFDNDGWFALCDAGAYQGACEGASDREAYFDCLDAQMRAGHLAIMDVGDEESSARFHFVDATGPEAAVWEHTFPLTVSTGRLHFVTALALGDVATSGESLLDQGDEIEDAGEFANGTYAVTFRRLPGGDPEADSDDPETWPVIEVVIEPGRDVAAPEHFPGREKW